MCEIADVSRTLLRDIEVLYNDCGEHSKSYDAFFNGMSTVSSPAANPDGDDQVTLLWDALAHLANHAYESFVDRSKWDYLTKLMHVLVISTRQTELWREMFGQKHRHSQSHHKTYMQGDTTDCMLDVAKHIISIGSEAPSSLTEDALRLIANCCAENNTNRELVIHRGGIEDLLHLSLEEVNLNILIPTLSNVCVDYDEPATALPSIEPKENDGSPGRETVTVAIERLAAANRTNPDCTTFEHLLSLRSRVSPDILPYLAELIEMSTQPALVSFDHIRSTEIQPWEWKFTTNGSHYDTITEVVALGRDNTHEVCVDSQASINRAILNLLSQDEVKNALLRREDDAIWRLMQVNVTEGLDDDAANHEDTALIECRKLLLKELYQITGDHVFSQSEGRLRTLLQKCTEYLEKECLKSASRNDGNFVLIVSACVILAQLAASDRARKELSESQKFSTILTLLLKERFDFCGVSYDRTQGDLLYPTITLVQRLALTERENLPFLQTGVLQSMQRFLTKGGIGLIIPYETLIAYKTLVRGRPEVVLSLIRSESQNVMIMEDVFQLWIQTVEAGTKLEISKLLLEMLRTMFSVLSKSSPPSNLFEGSELTQFVKFLELSATRIADIFVWNCLEAEPQSQRDHGWFGLAMLSTWPEARPGIFSAMEAREAFRDAIVKMSQSTASPTQKNLMLLLNELSESPPSDLKHNMIEILQAASKSLHLDSFRA